GPAARPHISRIKRVKCRHGEHEQSWYKRTMALHERSAGVIVFTKRAASKAPRFLLLDYGRYWDYPKGHVEKGEDDRAAALRELEEETGIKNVHLLQGFRHEINYFFRSKRGLVRKTVVFFLAQASPSQRVRLSDEHVGSAW